MSKIGLIIKREYLRRVSKKSFILLTFLTPFLFAALAFVPLWLSSIKGDEVHTVAILDATGKYAPLFEDTESYRFINGDKDMDKYRQMSEKEIFAFLNISDDLQVTGVQTCAEKSEKRNPLFQETNPSGFEPTRQYDIKEADRE